MAGMRSGSVIFIAVLYYVGLTVCVGQPQAQTKAFDAATVEVSIANKNLSGVTVLLESTPTNPLSDFDGYSASSQTDGSFHFEDVAPGVYRLVAHAKPSMYGEYGYRPPEHLGEILQVKAGDHIRGLSLELFPDPRTICGHVGDDNGKPLEINVEEYDHGIVWKKSDLGRANLQQPIRRSDSTGFFSIPGRQSGRGAFFIRAGGVWYPSTTDFSQAVSIESATQSAMGCKTKLRVTQSDCNRRVTAHIQSALRFPVSEYKASLFAVHPSGTLFLADSHPLSREDGVDFEAVCPGRYMAVLEHNGNGDAQELTSPVFQLEELSTTVTLGEETEEQRAQTAGLRESEVASASLKGKLTLEGLDWKQACSVPVSRQSELLGDGDYNGQFKLIDAEGNFSYDKLKPGTYRLTFGETAHGAAYIKSFSVDGQPADPAHFAIASGQAARVEAVFSNDELSAAGHLRADYTAEPHYLPGGTHPPASISGSVNGALGKGSVVALKSIRFNSARSAIYETTASEIGSFAFKSVDPGIYELFVKSGNNNQLSAYGAKGPGREGKPIVLSARQHLHGVSVKAYPKSSICGRVLNFDEKPVTGIEVWVEGSTTESGAVGSPKSWTKSAISDDQGRYRISQVGPSFLPLWAQVGQEKTFYLSVPDYPQGQSIDLGPDDGPCDYDIHIRSPKDSRAERGYKVSGTVEGQLDPSLGDHFHVNLIAVDPVHTPAVKPLEIKHTGEFDLQNVWPGSYTITITANYGNGTVPCGVPSSICFGYYQHLLASQQITIKDGALENVKLEIGSLPALEGQVLIDGREPDAKHPVGNPMLSGELANEGTLRANLDAHGHFSFPILDVRRYRIALDKYQPPYYIQSILLDGKPVDGETIQLKFGQAGHLVIRLASEGASGALTTAPGTPPFDSYRDLCRYFGGASSLILMIPDPLPADNSGIITGTFSTDGDARVSEVPPGHYHVLAVDDLILPGNRFFRLSGSVLLSKHEDLVKLGALGMPVEISPNQRFEVSAPIVTAQVRQMLAEEGIRSTF